MNTTCTHRYKHNLYIHIGPHWSAARYVHELIKDCLVYLMCQHHSLFSSPGCTTREPFKLWIRRKTRSWVVSPALSKHTSLVWFAQLLNNVYLWCGLPNFCAVSCKAQRRFVLLNIQLCSINTCLLSRLVNSLLQCMYDNRLWLLLHLQGNAHITCMPGPVRRWNYPVPLCLGEYPCTAHTSPNTCIHTGLNIPSYKQSVSAAEMMQTVSFAFFLLFGKQAVWSIYCSVMSWLFSIPFRMWLGF